MLTPHSILSSAFPDLPVRSTVFTLAASLWISLQLADEYGSGRKAYECLLAQLRERWQQPVRLSAAECDTARRSLLSTLLLAEEGLVEDPYGVLTPDALDAALSDLTTGDRVVQA